MFFLLTIIIIFVLIFYIERKKSIPKIIWTYWEGSEPPNSVQQCMKSWKFYNPDYTINIVTRDNLVTYLPEVDIYSMKMATTPQRVSDFVRLHLLEKYGGVWCDSTILMTDKLDYETRNEDFIGYYLNGFTINPDWPVIESWFFACPPHSTFIKNWKEAFIQINDFNTSKEYINYIKKEDVVLDGISFPEYLAIHVAAQYVLQKQMSKRDIKKNLYLEKAEDGPYRHMVLHNWNIYTGIKSLCDKKESNIIKFRGSERYIIDNDSELSSCIFNP